MKKLFLSAAAVLALSAPAAFAQDQSTAPDQNGKHQSAQTDRDRDTKAAKPDRDATAAPTPLQNRTATQDRATKERTAQASGTMSGGSMQGPNSQQNGDQDRDRANRGDNDRNANPPDRDDHMGNGDRDDHMGDRDRDDRDRVVHKTVDRNVIMKFHGNITAPRHFHFRAYVRPRGWYAHRWVYGERLPRAWFDRNYWIADWSAFGLIQPWPGYAWVQVGDDAVLVDLDTGEIVRVVYGIFY